MAKNKRPIIPEARESDDLKACRLNKELVQKELEIASLLREIESLKRLNVNQREHFTRCEEKLLHATESDAFNEISELKIREFVDKLLSDEDINIAYLPDWVERQLYVNILNLLVRIIRKSIQGSSIRLLGHEIHFTMKCELRPHDPPEM